MILHSKQHLMFGITSGLFLSLSIFIAVLPAFEAEKTLPLAGTPLPTEAVVRGRDIYLKEGCATCHTQFLRDLPVDSIYGRGSVAGDYALESPPLLGTQRTGPDLSNVGLRQPSSIWNLIHLYNPRAVVKSSVMPGYPWMFEEKLSAASDDILVPVPDEYKTIHTVIVARQEALDLVNYIQSLKQINSE